MQGEATSTLLLPHTVRKIVKEKKKNPAMAVQEVQSL
uniref:Uncharacterized protein n=1 Tax=Anguilla anguilla TaxID=7936 RepID=A0A0E9UIG3_ANGAN